jgi:phospholipase C
MDPPTRNGFTRRRLLRYGAGAALTLSPVGRVAMAMAQASGPIRTPNSLPDPTRPAGEPTAALPFDHVVVVMMENHSFDCYFGMLGKHHPNVDGYAFDANGRPTNSNPLDGGRVLVTPAPSECQGGVGQSWNSTHRQIAGGTMEGFAQSSRMAMAYWSRDDLPFYYSLAKNFTLANRWFCSAPCQTYPNRRFLVAGTAFGLVSTDVNSLSPTTPPPPNGTIFDRLAAHQISWRNYFTDLPATGVVPSVIEKYPDRLASIAQFHLDCATGSLPAVSFVDPEFGLAGEVGGGLATIPLPPVKGISDRISEQGQSEENPQDIQLGQDFVARVVNSVLHSPAWPRTLLVWLYDEHGGYYDHVPPPAAIKPDNIPPDIGPADEPGGYDMYGPRVPAVVASPYSKPHSTTDVVHDHTSILATIEAKWNLPACTYRDANAATLEDFLDLTRRPRLLEPPMLAEPGSLLPGERACSTNPPKLRTG